MADDSPDRAMTSSQEEAMPSNDRAAPVLAAIAKPVRSASGMGMTLFAGSFACGIAIGWHQPGPLVWPWLWASVGCIVIALAMRVMKQDGGSFIALLLSMMLLGAGWVALRLDFVADDDLAALIGDESTLVRVEGFATRSPETRARTSGSLARFDYRPPATYFPMRVEYLLPTEGEPIPASGRMLVRVDETMPPFRAGDRVKVTGFLLRPAMPRNPGEFDFRQYAKSLGQAGSLTVSGRELVEVTPDQRGAILSWFLNWRDDLRRRASSWLLANLPEGERPARDAMLASLMLGERDAEIDRVYESFQRVGLAHILAISGFHLAVLATFVMLIAQAIGGSRRWYGWIVIAAVLLYLMLVEPQMPVLRSGVMTIAGCLGTVFGRRLRVGGLVSLSAMMLLMWRPDQLFNAGFQLTYGVVLALIYLAPPVREYWFGRHNPEAATSMKMLGEWVKTAIAVTVTAWLAAVPIGAYHFGSIALVGIPMSIIAVPLSAVILALGFAKIILGAVLPSAALLIGLPLTVLAEMLLTMVQTIEPLPLASVNVPTPSTLWTACALAWVCWWCMSRKPQRRVIGRLKFVAMLIVVGWLLAPLLPLPSIPVISSRGAGDDVLRIDMLAVGDGSCYVLRSGGETMVFDAGSSTDLAAGDRSIVPAMRRLGIRSVDRICITHANLDHYSAVAEVAEAFDVGEVRITPQFMRAAESDPLSPMAFMLSRLVEERVRVIETSAGDEWMLGECRVECLHPVGDAAFDRVNDASMVLRVSAGTRRVLMSGDIQAAAMARLMSPDADLRADVLELPHHGSHHEVAVAFVDRVSPSVVMQSTGWTRWQRDRWREQMASKERLVTVRDGACAVRVDRDGAIAIERFLAPGVKAGGAEVE